MVTGTHRKPIRTRIADAGDAIRRRETFIAGDGSLSGTYRSANDVSTGRAPFTVRAEYDTACDQHGAELYVVRSYGTPIAWAGPGESLTVPDVRYSVTTSRHQGIARRADTAGECAVCGTPMIAAHRMRAAGHVHTTDPGAATPAPW